MHCLLKEYCATRSYEEASYSPAVNPLEEIFSKVKLEMKSMEAEMQVLYDIDTVVYSTFSWITPLDYMKWIENGAIYK